MARNALVVVALVSLVPLLPQAAADHEYEQDVWFNWDSTHLDVLVAAIEDPLVGQAILDSIEAWEVGIDQLSPSLGAALELRVYWPSRDLVPPPGFDANIAIIPQGGMAMVSDTGWVGTPECYAFAPLFVAPTQLYEVVAHEFGHCLGLAHVFEHDVEYAPAFDLMGSGAVESGRACPSNLNVLVLERVYAGGSGTVTMPASEYFQADC